MDFQQFVPIAQVFIFPLIAVIWWFSQQQINDLKERINKLEATQSNQALVLSNQLVGLRDAIADLKVQIITNHPTKGDIERWLSMQNIRIATPSSSDQ